MNYMDYALGAVILLFVYIVITKICMIIANYIGEQLGLVKLITRLLQKARRK